MDFVNFFFLHGEKTFKPTKTSHFFFSFIGKDLDKEATCHRNLFPSLCVCVSASVQQSRVRATLHCKGQSMLSSLGAQ